MYNSHMFLIHAERESVCMGDDCMVPNAKELSYEQGELISEFMSTVASYVPNMRNVVWAIYNEREVLGYLIFDENGIWTYELEIDDTFVSSLLNKNIFCRYFHSGKFTNIIDKEKYSECKTLLDKVKVLTIKH